MEFLSLITSLNLIILLDNFKEGRKTRAKIPKIMENTLIK